MSRKPESRQGSVREMLTEIDNLPPEEQASRLCWLIERIDITRGKPSTKVATADLLLGRTITICRTQSQRMLGLRMPISKQEERILHHFLKALTFLDAFYTTAFGVLTDRTRERGPDDKSYVGRCLAGRAMCAREVLLMSATAHLNWPTGVWSSLHRVWRQSHKLELAGYVSDISRQKHSVQDIYTSCLILGLADPYRLPFRGVHAVYDMVCRALAGAIVKPLKPDSRARMLFLIKPKEDVPGIPLHNVDVANMTGHRYVLDVTTFVNTMEQLSSEHVTPARAAETVDHLNESERNRSVYNHLRLNLGIRPTRITNREPDNERYLFYTGFTNVRTLISNISGSSQVDKQSISTDEIHPDIGSPGTAIGLDRSVTGLKLQLVNNVSDRLRAGDVVALQCESDDNAQWRVGYVRWVRGGGNSALDFGVEVISGIPVGVTMSMLDEDDPTLDFDVVRCIAVLDDIEEPVKATVIASREIDYLKMLRQLWIGERIRLATDHTASKGSDIATCITVNLHPLNASGQHITSG